MLTSQTSAVSIEPGDMATWVTGIATAGAWVAALTGIHRERQAREAFNADTRVREERSQAVLISSWYGSRVDDKHSDVLMLSNRSDAPVYNVVVTMILAQGAGPTKGEDFEHLPHLKDHQSYYTALPPGTWTAPAPNGWRGMHARPGCEIAFTDAAGLHWVRRGDGQLAKLPTVPFDYFNIPRPIDLRSPEPA